jgi:hypothetical protein
MPVVTRQQRLGWFVPFMNAWGRATGPVQAQLEAAVQSYATGYISGATLIQRVDELLGLAIPLPADSAR